MSSHFCLQTHSLLISIVSSCCSGDIYLKKYLHLIEKWQVSPRAWAQQRGVRIATPRREHAKSIEGSSCTTMCCHV